MVHSDPQDGCRRATALIVDNDRSIALAVRTRLEHAGYVCLTPDSTQEAMATFSLREIDLVVTDLDMPGVDGLGFIAMVRHVSAVPIIVISGFAEKYRQAVGSFSEVTLLPKPFDSSALLELVQEKMAATNAARAT